MNKAFTAKGSITVNGSYSDSPATIKMVLYDQESGYMMPSDVELTAETPEEVDAVVGSVFIITNTMDTDTITVSGAEELDDGEYAVTDDFSISFTYGA